MTKEEQAKLANFFNCSLSERYKKELEFLPPFRLSASSFQN